MCFTSENFVFQSPQYTVGVIPEHSFHSALRKVSQRGPVVLSVPIVPASFPSVTHYYVSCRFREEKYRS